MKLFKLVFFLVLTVVLVYTVFTLKAFREYKRNYQDCSSIYSGETGKAPSSKDLCEQANKILKWKIYHPFGNYFDYYSPLL